MNPRDRDLKYIAIKDYRGATVVVFNPPDDFRNNPIAGKRSDNARKWFRRCNLALASDHSDVDSDEFAIEWDRKVAAKIRGLDSRLRAIFDAPVSARTARLVLGLSPEDFSQIVKNGTLPTFSRLRVGSAKSSFSVPVFDPDAIETLRRRNEHLTAIHNICGEMD